MWSGILSAGIVTAEISTPNVNVFYELGAARAIEKDILLLKQHNSSVLPADVQAMLYCEYDFMSLNDAKAGLTRQLSGSPCSR
jgi:predicted nucleotide-binding protein